MSLSISLRGEIERDKSCELWSCFSSLQSRISNLRGNQYVQGQDVARPAFGVIIPVYNSAAAIPALLEQIADAVNIADLDLRVLIVDDGSEPALPVFQSERVALTQIRHTENQGKGAALKSGFAHFLQADEVQAVITIDADLQHPPRFIPDFIRKHTDDGCDLVVGFRHRSPKTMPVHRIMSNSITSFIISKMIGERVPDSQCGYRLYSRKALECISLDENRFHLESEFVLRAGWKKMKIGHVDVPTIYNGAPSAIRGIPDTLDFIRLVFRLGVMRMFGHV